MSDYFLKMVQYLIVSAQSYFMLSKIPKLSLYREMLAFFTEFLMNELLIFFKGKLRA